MAPLVIGNPHNLSSAQTQEAFNVFRGQLYHVKQMGAQAVSTDVWWGLVEPEDNKFNWDYYKKIADAIESQGLKWVPILSFHQCGGNVGDECDIKIPSFLWQKYGDDIAYKSEQGNVSRESISAWSTALVLSEYRDVMNSFRENFNNRAYMIDEINISLGPAGEMRYPSYNGHDQNAGYPTRGSLQAYSPLAVKSFREYMSDKYGQIQNLNSNLGFNLNSFENVFPPNPVLFFSKNESYNNYGKDFYDWYSQSLRQHGYLLVSESIKVFRDDFSQTSIGFKVPGIHWRAAPGSDRLAELAAGLITTSDDLNSEDTGHGYKKIIDLVSQIKTQNNFSKINLHFTCLEMDNYEGGDVAQSFAKALVFWVGREAVKQNVRIMGENALAGTLGSPRAWENMRDALVYGGYDGLTILRMGNLLENFGAGNQFYNSAKDLK